MTNFMQRVLLLTLLCMFSAGNARADPAPLAGGGAHTLFLAGNGDLYAFVLSSDGQLGLGDALDRDSPVLVRSGVVMATASIRHSLIYTTDGKVYAAGGNQYGQLGTGSTEPSISFVEIAQADVMALEFGLHLCIRQGHIRAALHGEHRVVRNARETLFPCTCPEG